MKGNTTFCVVASQIFTEEGMYKEALQLLSGKNKSLERLLVKIHILLRINRDDLAKKTLRSMEEIDDDDPLTTLAKAQLYLTHGLLLFLYLCYLI